MEGSLCPNWDQFTFRSRPTCLDCAYQSMRVAGWEFPEVSAVMHRQESESRMTCEIPESLIR